MKHLPDKPRTEIMLQKRVADMNLPFENRELAEMYALDSQDWFLLGFGSFFLAGIGLFVFLSPLKTSDYTSVCAMLFFSLFLFIPVLLRRLKKRLYIEASRFVLHNEPVRAFVELVHNDPAGEEGCSWNLKITPVGEDRFWVKTSPRGTANPIYKFGDRFKINKFIKKHPELLQGAEAEVYFDGKKRLLGIFAGDHVDWLI
jgi:hypothetical protein